MCCKKNIKETESPKGFVKQYNCVLWNEVLTPIEKMYLSLIISFKKDGKDFLCCNDYVSQIIGITDRHLRRVKSALISKGLIRREERSGYSNSIILEKENLAEFLGCDLFSMSEEPTEQNPIEEKPVKKMSKNEYFKKRLEFYDNKFKEKYLKLNEKK